MENIFRAEAELWNTSRNFMVQKSKRKWILSFQFYHKKGRKMSKKVWFLVLLLSFLGCKTKLPTSPDIPEVGLPVIDYFYAAPPQISVGEGSTLFWRVHGSGRFGIKPPLNIFIHWGYGESIKVGSAGTLEVYPKTTTIYKLTAYVGTGKSIRSATEFVTVSVGL